MEEKIYYHIHRIQDNPIEQQWKMGSKIDIGKEKNYFFTMSTKFEPKFPEIEGKQNIPWENVYKYYKEDGRLTDENIFMLLDSAKYFISEYQILLREILYEDVRKNKFNSLPSRQKCIWLCKKKQLEFWKKYILPPYKVFKVEIEGKTFKSNNKLIISPSESYDKIIEKAKAYWSYDNKNENKDDEYLYIGKLKILEEIKEK